MDVGTSQSPRTATQELRQRKHLKCEAKLMSCAECDWVKNYQHNIGANNRMPWKYLAKMIVQKIAHWLSIAGQ